MAAAFVGICGSSATRFFGPTMGARHIAKLSSFLFVMLALAVSAFSLSIVMSGGAILSDWSILPPAACVAVLVAFSWRFPRVFGFPVVVGLGAAVAIMGYCLFSLPPAPEEAPLGSIVLAQGEAVSVRFAGADVTSRQVEDLSSPVLPVHAEVLVVRFHKLWPVFGGAVRGSLRAVRIGTGSSLLSPKPLPIDFLFSKEGRAETSKTPFWGIRIDKISGDLAPDTVAVGERFGIYLRAGSIRFIP